jgi:rhamnosyltransferase subunit B
LRTVVAETQTLHFILTPTGSHGDVHPYVGIGRRLRERGHEVTVLAAGVFRELIESSGLGYLCTWSEEEYERITHDPDLWHPTRGLALLLRTVADNLRRGYELIEEVWEPGAVLVGHTISFSTRVFQDRHGAAGATIHLAPSAIRSTWQVPPITPRHDPSRWPRFVKRAAMWGVDRFLIHPHIVPQLNAFRAELGLRPVYRPFRDWLSSPQLALGMFPPWYGMAPPDWPPQLVEVGFPLYDEAERGPSDPGLEAFLESSAAGGGAIVFTPGSAYRQGTRFFEAALAAGERLGKPALLLTGFAEQLPEPLPAHAYHAPYAPFSRVFPRCAAVVHHGGIGTLSQALRAGVPQLVMPMSYDQPDNALRLRRLGAGDWLEPADFQAEPVAAKLETLIASADVADACRKYRDALAGHDAIALACELLEGLGRR